MVSQTSRPIQTKAIGSPNLIQSAWIFLYLWSPSAAESMSLSTLGICRFVMIVKMMQKSISATLKIRKGVEAPRVWSEGVMRMAATPKRMGTLDLKRRRLAVALQDLRRMRSLTIFWLFSLSLSCCSCCCISRRVVSVFSMLLHFFELFLDTDKTDGHVLG